jgi:hypothetical protein
MFDVALDRDLQQSSAGMVVAISVDQFSAHNFQLWAAQLSSSLIISSAFA